MRSPVAALVASLVMATSMSAMAQTEDEADPVEEDSAAPAADDSAAPTEESDPMPAADSAPMPAEDSAPMPAADSAPAAERAPAETEEDAGGATQEMGARIGLDVGGRVSPGGLLLSGTYLYRLSDQDWLDQSVGFTFGGRGAACFRDRSDDLLCDHGILDGFAIDAAIGLRRYLTSSDEFSPYVRAGIAFRGVVFTGDDVSGFAFPVFAAGGVRAKVAPRVSVVADAMLRTGFAIFNRGLGVEPHASFAVQAGVELVLD